MTDRPRLGRPVGWGIDAVGQLCRSRNAHPQLALVQHHKLSLGQSMAPMELGVAGSVRLCVAGETGVSVVSYRQVRSLMSSGEYGWGRQSQEEVEESGAGGKEGVTQFPHSDARRRNVKKGQGVIILPSLADHAMSGCASMFSMLKGQRAPARSAYRRRLRNSRTTVVLGRCYI